LIELIIATRIADYWLRESPVILVRVEGVLLRLVNEPLDYGFNPCL
jgi:hypothetical protein